MSEAASLSSSSSSSSSSSTDASLDGFCVLARNSTGIQSVMVIRQALRHAQTFVFGELLEIASIQQLRGTEHDAWYQLLDLFAHGTYGDYKARAGTLPELSAQELLKLKALTIVSLAAQSSSLTYADLMRALDIQQVRELEDLIIDCIYHGLLSGCLDQQAGVFRVDSVLGRDLGPSDVATMIQSLDDWLTAADRMHDNLQQQAAMAKQQFAAARRDDQSLSTVYADRLKSAHAAKAKRQHAEQQLDMGRMPRGKKGSDYDMIGGGGYGSIGGGGGGTAFMKMFRGGR